MEHEYLLMDCRIEFTICDDSAYSRMTSLFEYIKEIKALDIQVSNLCNDSKLVDFFTEAELDYFWWPTKQEAAEFWKLYAGLSREEKDKLIEAKSWDFETVFDEIGQGEYRIVGCERIDKNIGILHFDPVSFPYGGAQPIVEVIKAFGMKIVSLTIG